MRIQKLDIKGFGKLNNFEIEFSKGLNIVFGANESGKSTIQAFIRAMFYSLKGGKSKGGIYNPLNRYRPWFGRDYKGSLKYVLDNGQSYKVERNFENGETKVYDFLYKDITKTFDQSKDKGPLFAIRHIGLNENCFKKTLYIGQMATKIDNSGREEILDRLSNISQTGYEDVSFFSASEAIKETLKVNVGTDKTSTRPLDIINTKLDELSDKRKRLLDIKGSMFSLKEEMEDLNKKRKKLEEAKVAINFAKNIVKIREQLNACKRKKKDLGEIVFEISQRSKQYEDLNRNAIEYKTINEQFNMFSKFGFSEADDLYIKYTKYENLVNENSRLIKEIKNLKKGVHETETFLEKFKDMTKIRALQFKNIAIVAAISAICLSIVGLVVYAYFSKNYFYIIGAFLLAIICCALFALKLNNNKELNSLKYKIDEMDNKHKKSMNEGIVKKNGFLNRERFLEEKCLCDSKDYELNIKKEKIKELEAEVDNNSSKNSEILKSIKKILFETEITNSMEDSVNKEHIETFRSAINNYKETVPYLSSVEERLSTINNQIKNLYTRANSICEQSIENNADLMEVMRDIDNKIEKLYENLDIYACKIKSIYPDSEFGEIKYDKFMEVILDLDIEEAKGRIDEFTKENYEAINDIQIILKEKEMILSALNDDNNELEKIEDDIQELEVKKEKLEEIGFSLKTALVVLEEANNEIKRDFAPILNDKASKLVSSITSSEYEELKVDENFILRTTDPSLKDIVPVSLLSGATIDQMYLALRIALIQTIENSNERLPLIMDEILSQYDDERSLDTITLLKEMSNQRQIIFFTCKKREVELVKSVCNNNINIIEL